MNRPAAPQPRGDLRRGGREIGYRPDIDGLRAIAVASVVVFHAGFGAIPGGFVGVDIFFVISGYLIGGQIFKEAAAGQFSFVRFYARRTRRILPALFAMMLILLAVAWVVLTPLELRELAKESVAAALGLSNILFYTGNGYFAPTADHSPLLMTWSLGVEEQFYLLFPLLCLALLRLRLPVFPLLAALCILSFAGSILLIRMDPNAVFYLLPTRAWELGIGGLLALRDRDPGSGLRPRAGGGVMSDLAAAAGLLAIAAALAFYHPSFAFPGIFVLLPTLGTVALIATRDSIINRRLLSLPAMSFTGRVSYSWYLWHWPLFYLHRVLGGDGGLASAISLITLSFVLGLASWRWIEQPFRRRRDASGRSLAAYALATLLVCVLAGGLYVANGAPQRLTPLARSFAEAVSASRADACLAPYGATSLRADRCVPSSQQPRLVLLGDSHASSLAAGMQAVATRAGMSFGQMTKSSCQPLWLAAREVPDRPAHWNECIAYLQAALARIESDPGIRIVALAGYWASAPEVTSATDGARMTVSLAEALDRMVARLQAGGRHVVLVQDVPKFAFDPYARVMGASLPVRAMLSRWLSTGRADGDFASAEVLADPSSAIVAEVAERRGARLFDPREALCTDKSCRFRSTDALYYSDFQHLTHPGAMAAMKGFALP